ncbi:MAG TPA: IS66 family transposase [Gammaproteobacteria bacterium]|nr:IS66 family transposase [Gammaproteobacteria bacterium]
MVALTQEQAAAGADDGGGEDGGDGGGEKVHRRPHKPTGRSTAREHVQKLTMELLPEEVKRLGLCAFERIGEETSTTVERRVSALVEVTVVRPKFRAKTEAAEQAVKAARQAQGSLPEQTPQSWITVAAAPELPLPRSMAGPGLLANVIVRRFDDHLPYNRLENIYEREGMRLGRSTLYGWLDGLRELFAPLLTAMIADARRAPYLCVDATGVLVQASERCSRGHFWVLVAPGRHVVFAFSHSHDSAAVDKLLGGYEGHVVADAHAVYDHLYRDDGAIEVGCWGHARSYFFKALGSEPEIAREVLANLRVMFMLERKLAEATRKQRERMRASKVKLLVDRHFELCRKHEAAALDGSPLRAAIRYSLNQEQPLRRFLDDGRLPATNNISERQLRRQAVGRRNWLFVGSDDGAAVNTTFASLVASCHLNDVEPESYLREVMCLLPDWPKSRILELAPCNWKQTRQQPEAQQLLADNLWLFALREIDAVHARLA